MEHKAEYTAVEKMLIAKAIESGTPINGVLELTPLCNMNCDMCYVRLDKRTADAQGGLRSLENWLDIAGQIKDAGGLFLLLTGGEPLTYPHFKDLYLKLLEMGMIVSINTNGTLIDEEWARFFVENKPRQINITLYGTNNETYQKLCHYSEGYEKTVNAIKLLKDHQVDVKMNCTVARDNVNEIDEHVKLAEELGVPITIDTYIVSETRERELPFDQQSRLEPSEAAIARVKAFKAGMNEDEFWHYTQKVFREAYNIATGKCRANLGTTCYAGKCSFMITWKGIMKPCAVMKGIEADVLEVGFANAWKHIVDETAKLRLNAKCAACPNKPACRTCVAAAKAETGAYDGLSDYICEYAKESMRLLDGEARRYREARMRKENTLTSEE